MDVVVERYFGALAGATGITFGLFWLMTTLIHIEGDVSPEKVFTTVEIVDVMLDRPVEPIRRTPPIQKRPIESPTLDHLDPNDVIPNEYDIPILSPDPSEQTLRDPRRPSLSRADGDSTPLVRVPPRYPILATRRGIEGRVLVSFTIGKDGSVYDVRVLAAEPPDVFDAAAVKAVRQWRYEPKIVDGDPVEQRDQRISIPFRIEDASG
jgi:protein TonB